MIKKKTKKKVSKKPTVKQLDKLWSEVVRLRDKYTCCVCGETDRRKIQAMHIIGRGEWVIRWELANGIAGCTKCHKFYTHRPGAWQNWLEENYTIRYAILKLYVSAWYKSGCPNIDREGAKMILQKLKEKYSD